MEQMMVERRAIVATEGELREMCWGKRIPEIQDSRLRNHLQQIAKQWLLLREKAGQRFVDRDDIHVYGPWPTDVMLEPMLTQEHMEIDGETARQIVRERASSREAFNNYLLNAHFVVGRKPALKGV